MDINVKGLKKDFISYERGEGFWEAIKSLVIRKKKVFHAIKGIDFSVRHGEIVGFLGPNGAGKSTTIKILSGIVYPDAGEVNVAGFIPWKHRKRYVGNIGVVFGQKSQLFWDLPPIDAFHFNKTIYRIDEDKFNKRLEKLTRMLDIRSTIQRPSRQLSLGERMRCEFVMAMLHSPTLVFLDEPTIGLDIFAKQTIRNFIKKINRQEKTTFIVTSHDLEDIENLCHRLIIINKGKIVFNDSTKNLKVGNKKYITLSFYNRIDKERLRQLKGVRILKRYSDYNVLLEVDTTHRYLDEVIKEIRMGKRIMDVEIKEPPVSEIIKKLYKK